MSAKEAWVERNTRISPQAPTKDDSRCESSQFCRCVASSQRCAAACDRAPTKAISIPSYPSLSGAREALLADLELRQQGSSSPLHTIPSVAGPAVWCPSNHRESWTRWRNWRLCLQNPPLIRTELRPEDCSGLFRCCTDQPHVNVLLGSLPSRPRGPMDKASAYGAGDCRFESCRGQSLIEALMMEQQSGELVDARSNVGTVRRRANAK